MNIAPPKKKDAFLLFHINLSFSSIEIDQHYNLIKKCYWPLLNLIAETKIKTAIEITGSSLQKIHELDPSWINYFVELNKEGLIELIGSGRYQIIGPLIPYEVNLYNQKMGLNDYKNILDIKPTCALVNEMTFSSGVVDFYLEAGFNSLIMERNNVALALKKKNLTEVDKIKYINGSDLQSIKVLWSDSIMFQRLQRFVHNDISMDNYFDELSKYQTKFEGPLPIYSNDVEVFNFRPGRFNEESIIDQDEWKKLKSLLLKLKKQFVTFDFPSKLTSCNDYIDEKKSEAINSGSYPAIVKKQPKYNLTRWALTGRNDLWINTLCHRAYLAITNSKKEEVYMDELLQLWSSDLRTHITETRWNEAITKMTILCNKLSINPSFKNKEKSNLNLQKENKFFNGTVDEDLASRMLVIRTDQLTLNLNPYKGLAIDSLCFASQQNKKLIGSLPAYHFESIELGADFYSGGLLIESPQERRRYTDYNFVSPSIFFDDDKLLVTCNFQLGIGKFKKTFVISDSSDEVILRYEFVNWKKSASVIRVGNFVLMNENFNKDLYYQVVSGGKYPELFKIDSSFDHSHAVSSFISSRTCIPSTDGTIIVGDEDNALKFQWDMSKSACLPMLVNRKSEDDKFTRLIFSLSEIDDTAKTEEEFPDFEMSISPFKKDFFKI